VGFVNATKSHRPGCDCRASKSTHRHSGIILAEPHSGSGYCERISDVQYDSPVTLLASTSCHLNGEIIMKYFLISLMLIGLPALTACSSPPVKDPDSFLYSVPVGSKLILNKEITIPENLARRYFQNGRAIQKNELNIYYPHCSILMNILVDYERVIKPTVFEIYVVEDQRDYAQRPVYVASNILNNIDGQTIIGYASLYYLRSPDEPDVRSLECVRWDNPVHIQFLSINEVKKALGQYFRLEIND
jgi:hypothetical protein